MFMAEYSIFVPGTNGIVVDRIISISDKRKILRYLDKFTSEFENEESLKIYLKEKGLLAASDFNKSLKISYKRKNKMSCLPIIYKANSKYMNIEYLKNIFFGFKNDKNYNFYSDLIEYYGNIDSGNLGWKSQALNIGKINYCLEQNAQGNDINYNSDLNRLFNEAIESFFERAVYTKNSKGALVEDYSGLRILAIFIHRFCNKQEEIKERIAATSSKIDDLRTLRDEVLPPEKEDTVPPQYTQLTFSDILR